MHEQRRNQAEREKERERERLVCGLAQITRPDTSQSELRFCLTTIRAMTST
jgi:hypothetical protein